MARASSGDPRSALRWLLPSLLGVLVIAALSGALFGGFLRWWDDYPLLVDNRAFRGLAWPQLRWMFTTNLMGHYMPVTWITYGLDYLVWGMDPLGYHLTSLLLHGANVMLVYFIALRLFERAGLQSDAGRGDGLRVGAVLTALAFGLHPLRVESVAWITERRDVLCGFFYLLTIVTYLRAVEAEPRDRSGARRLYWGAVGLFLAALLSKSMAVTLPAVLLVLDVYPLRRLRPGVHGWLAPGPRRVWIEKLPFVLAAGLAGAAALGALLSAAGATTWDRLGFLERLAVSAHSLSFYLWKTMVPLALSPLYELPQPVRILDLRYLAAGAVALAITAAAVVLRRRWPGLLAVWACYVAMLLPVMGILHNGYQITADRYSYLPTIGWAVLLGGVVASARRGAGSDRVGRRALAAAAIVVLFAVPSALGLAARGQVEIWRDDETLWRHAVRLDPGSSVAASNLGAALLAQGRLAEALAESERAVRLRPTYAEAHLNLALAKAGQGRRVEAEAHLRRAIEIRPRSAPAHARLGAMLQEQGRLDEALEHLNAAVQIAPESAGAHNDLGVALARSGRVAEARAEFSEAVRIDPGFARAQNNLGLTMAQMGQLSAAADHFRTAIRSQPDFAEARRNLDEALRRSGDRPGLQ